MAFKIPFAFSNIERLKKSTKFIAGKIRYKKDTKLEEQLKIIGVDATREQYLAICIRSFLIVFVLFLIIATTILAFLKIRYFYLYGFGLALMFSMFIYFSQRIYPRIYITRKQREIDKNLLPALQDMLVQLNSGVPLFNIMSNLSLSDYGALSLEFKKAVKRISTGEPEDQVLDSLGESNPSVFFRRTLWQINNGLRSGSDMSIVVQDTIKALNEEQLIQIQNYGNKLNPLIMMYMLISVIIPALSIAFLTIISSMVNLAEQMTQLMFIGLFIFVVLMQVMFLGLIKSRRPTLL